MLLLLSKINTFDLKKNWTLLAEKHTTIHLSEAKQQTNANFDYIKRVGSISGFTPCLNITKKKVHLEYGRIVFSYRLWCFKSLYSN